MLIGRMYHAPIERRFSSICEKCVADKGGLLWYDKLNK